MAVGLLHGGTPADFAVAQGAVVDILDENGDPIVDPDDTETTLKGATALLPTKANVFQLYDAPGGSQVTELYTYPEQDPITEITSLTDYDTRATFPLFFAPDTHEGDLYASADEVTYYRLPPATDTLFARVGVVETSVDDLTTKDLEDVSEDPPSDGDVPVWNNSLGVWEPVAGANPSTLAGLLDVEVSGASNGQLLSYDAGEDEWVPANPEDPGDIDGSDIVSGTVDVARLPVGSNAWNVAAGNHGHSISGVSGLQTALDEKVNVADVAKVWPVIDAEDPTPGGAVEGDIIVRRQA